jgi:hypothetical protein
LRDIFFVRRSNVWPPSIGKTMCVLPTKTRQCSARPHDASIEAALGIERIDGGKH